MLLSQFIRKISSAQRSYIHFSQYHMYFNLHKVWELKYDTLKEQPQYIKDAVKKALNTRINTVPGQKRKSVI